MILDANMEALKITLTEGQIKELESALSFDFGFPFPYNFLISSIPYPHIVQTILCPVHRKMAPTIMQRLTRVVGSMSGQSHNLSVLSNKCVVFAYVYFRRKSNLISNQFLTIEDC
jgi:hypothetical protein